MKLIKEKIADAFASALDTVVTEAANCHNASVMATADVFRRVIHTRLMRTESVPECLALVQTLIEGMKKAL